MNENRTYGIEIELIHGDKHAMARAINAAGIEIEVEGYNHTTRNHWKIVPDGSVTGGYEESFPPNCREPKAFARSRLCAVPWLLTVPRSTNPVDFIFTTMREITALPSS